MLGWFNKLKVVYVFVINIWINSNNNNNDNGWYLLGFFIC